MGVRLGNDIARCDGNGEPACESCARRLSERGGLNWYATPMAKGDDCELFMETRYTITAKGRELLGRKA